MKVAIVTSSYPSFLGEPAGLFVQHEAARLAAEGHEVTVFAPGRSPSNRKSSPRVVRIPDGGAFGPPGVLPRLKRRPWRMIGAFRFVFEARRRLRELGPFDRIDAHWLLPSAWPICQSLPNSKLLIVLHGGDVRLLLQLPGPVRRAIVSSLLKMGARFRFVSRQLRKDLIDASVPELAAASFVERCTVSVQGAPSRIEARRQLGISGNTQLCLIVARLVPSKRIPLALEALRHLSNLRLVVIGGGPGLSTLQREFPRVEFLGQLPHFQTLSYIAASDVFVSPSATEGSPLAVREARALGVPVVALEAGDLAELAVGDRDFLLLPSSVSG